MNLDKDELAILHLGEILNERTQRTRRTLLATSGSLIVMLWTGFLPSTILGFDFDVSNRWVALWFLGLTVLYQLILFVSDGMRDYFVWNREFNKKYLEIAHVGEGIYELSKVPGNYLKKDEKKLYHFRYFLILIFPLCVSLFSVGYLVIEWLR